VTYGIITASVLLYSIVALICAACAAFDDKPQLEAFSLGVLWPITAIVTVWRWVSGGAA
jgi:hypothetical protein